MLKVCGRTGTAGGCIVLLGFGSQHHVTMMRTRLVVLPVLLVCGVAQPFRDYRRSSVQRTGPNHGHGTTVIQMEAGAELSAAR